MYRKAIAACVAATLLLGLTAIASADIVILTSFPGINGEYGGGEFNNWIQLAGFEHRVPSLPKPQQLCNGVAPQEMQKSFDVPASVVKEIDRASPALMKEVDRCSPKLASACQQGRMFPSVKLALCNIVDGEPRGYFTLNFEETKIASYQVYAPGFGDRPPGFPPDRPFELLKLMPQRITWEWTGE